MQHSTKQVLKVTIGICYKTKENLGSHPDQKKMEVSKEFDEKTRFDTSFLRYWEITSTQPLVPPLLQGKELNFYRLYKAVCRRGGEDLVSRMQAWSKIKAELNLGNAGASTSYTLKKHYSAFMINYEKFFNRTIPQLNEAYEDKMKSLEQLYGLQTHATDQIQQEIISTQQQRAVKTVSQELMNPRIETPAKPANDLYFTKKSEMFAADKNQISVDSSSPNEDDSSSSPAQENHAVKTAKPQVSLLEEPTAKTDIKR